MKDFYTFQITGDTPILVTAIHDGHELSFDLLEICALSESSRLREEDPYTGKWTEVADNRIIAHHSRFEFDLNRPPEKAIYLDPADAWGLEVWKTRPSAAHLEKTIAIYHHFYARMRESLEFLTGKFGRVVVLDLHTYNHRRNGPDGPVADPEENPEVNLGTGTMNRDRWTKLVDRVGADLSNFDFAGRHLDVRENIKFKGGYFPRWIHENFPETVCCISIEFKKFFMNEWTGIPDHHLTGSIGKAVKSTLPGILEELAK